MIKSTWRFFLGAAIGAGIGYSLVLLTLPSRRNPAPGWQVLYQANREQREEQRAN